MSERTRIATIAVLLLMVGVSTSAEISRPIESRVIRVAMPEYPGVPRHAAMSGVVEVAAMVDSQGAVSAHVAKSSNPMFDQAALNAAKQWTLALGTGEVVTLTFRFSSKPECTMPARVAIYTPPFTVEVFEAKPLGTVSDGYQPSCPQVEIREWSNQ